MATAFCAPGLRPEPGATTGKIAVGSVSELVLWGPTQEPGLSRGAWSGTPTAGLGRPFHGTARLLQRFNQRTALIAWLESRGSGSCTQQIWGKFQGDRGSRSRDVSSVEGVAGSSHLFLVPTEGGVLRSERGEGPGSCSSLGSRPWIVVLGDRVGDSRIAGLQGVS